MHHSTPIFPHVPAQLTGQALVSQAGLGVLTSFLNALDFRRLCEDRLSQFVPATAIHRSGKMIADLAIMLAAGGEEVTDIDQLRSSPGLHGPVAFRSHDQPVYEPDQGPTLRVPIRVRYHAPHLTLPGFGPQPDPATLLLEPPSRTH